MAAKQENLDMDEASAAHGASPALRAQEKELSALDELKAIVEFGNDFAYAVGGGAAMWKMAQQAVARLELNQPRGGKEEQMSFTITRHFGNGRTITVSPLEGTGVPTSISLTADGKVRLEGWNFYCEDGGHMDDEALRNACEAAIEVMRAALDAQKITVFGDLLGVPDTFDQAALAGGSKQEAR